MTGVPASAFFRPLQLVVHWSRISPFQRHSSSGAVSLKSAVCLGLFCQNDPQQRQPQQQQPTASPQPGFDDAHFTPKRPYFAAPLLPRTSRTMKSLDVLQPQARLDTSRIRPEQRIRSRKHSLSLGRDQLNGHTICCLYGRLPPHRSPGQSS